MDDSRDGREQRDGAEAPPPIGGSWIRLYVAVLTTLALLITAFVAITRHFS